MASKARSSFYEKSNNSTKLTCRLTGTGTFASH
jgi:hypothetical protein